MYLFKQYILSLTAVALIISIVCSLLADGGRGSPVRFLCALILTITAIHPATDIKIPEISYWMASYREDAANFAAQGRQLAESASLEIIKHQTESYILNIANQFHGDLTVDVFLEENLPVSVIFTGKISPYGKQHLEKVLEKDLGITKENIAWL